MLTNYYKGTMSQDSRFSEDQKSRSHGFLALENPLIFKY